MESTEMVGVGDSDIDLWMKANNKAPNNSEIRTFHIETVLAFWLYRYKGLNNIKVIVQKLLSLIQT